MVQNYKYIAKDWYFIMKLTFDPPAINMDANRLETVPGITPSFPYIIDKTDISVFPIPWHWHEELEFIKVEEGDEDVLTNNGVYLVRAGEGYFVNTNVMTMKRKSEGSETTYEIGHVFHPVLLYGHYGSLIEQKYMRPVLQDPTLEVVIMRKDTEPGQQFIRALDRLTNLQDESGPEDAGRVFLTRNLLSEGWLALLREIRTNPDAHRRGSAQGTDRIRQMMQFINNHYARKITLQEIADSAFSSKRECIRTFHRNLSKTPVEYLTQVRLENARAFLARPEKSITQIAEECGFSDSSYFTKIFRENYHMTPKEYRRQLPGGEA